MRLAIIIFLSVVAICVFLYVWLMWRDAKATAQILRRLAPALLEWNPFERLLAIISERSHALERHGPMTYREEQLQRALTGLLEASGVAGKPVDSARWITHQYMLDAIESAKQRWQVGERPNRGVFFFEFCKDIGEGYAANTNQLITTRHAKVVIRSGEIITAFPVIIPNIAVEWDQLLEPKTDTATPPIPDTNDHNTSAITSHVIDTPGLQISPKEAVSRVPFRGVGQKHPTIDQ